MTVRRRIKVSATLDPELLDAIDRFVETHPGADRSGVLDEALRLWSIHQQELAMESQFRDDSGVDPQEWASWRAIRHAAAQQTPPLDEE